MGFNFIASEEAALMIFSFSFIMPEKQASTANVVLIGFSEVMVSMN